MIEELQVLPPRGWDFCEWADATDVLTPTGGIYGVELKKVGQYVESIIVDFEPGCSEIGTHQAKFCLGLKPVRRNLAAEKTLQERDSHVVTFDFIREYMAGVVRDFAEELSVQASQVEKGDLRVFLEIPVKMSQWWGDADVRYKYLEAHRGQTVTEETLLDL